MIAKLKHFMRSVFAERWLRGVFFDVADRGRDGRDSPLPPNRSLIHLFNLSAYSSVLCLLAHRTFPRGNALPVGYLARRASTRIGLQPIRSGDYPATPTPPFQGGEKSPLPKR